MKYCMIKWFMQCCPPINLAGSSHPKALPIPITTLPQSKYLIRFTRNYYNTTLPQIYLGKPRFNGTGTRYMHRTHNSPLVLYQYNTIQYNIIQSPTDTDIASHKNKHEPTSCIAHAGGVCIASLLHHYYRR